MPIHRNKVFLLRITVLLQSALWALLLGSCANQVAPTGGPKDVSPPKVESENPANYGTQFSQNKIRLNFDEFIKLENPQKNVLISPPFSTQPEIRLHGKSIDILLQDSLKANTTYTIYFSNAIADITEGNKLRNYSYIFSTGDSIDMYGLKGKVVDAFSSAAEDGMAVMLYPYVGDTLPFKSRPYYLSRSNEKGEFEFRNIGPGPYWLIALMDANANLKYDLPNEKIAFIGGEVSPYELEEQIDSASGRKSYVATDPTSISLFSFDEFATDFKVMKAGMRRAGLIEIVLNRPSASLNVRLLNHNNPGSWMREERSVMGDSLLLWLSDPISDSIFLEIIADGEPIDSSLILPLRPIQTGGKTQGKAQLQLSGANVSGGKHPHNQDLIIACSYPIFRHEAQAVLIVEGTDSIKAGITFVDSLLMKAFRIDYTWKENQAYIVTIPQGAFESINGLSSDSLRLSFNTYSTSDLGNLRITLPDTLPTADIILSLLDKKGNALATTIVRHGKQEAHFKQLLPGDYSLRAIIDANTNGYWDPGTTHPAQQAEKVVIYTQPITVKANWDLDLEWKIADFLF